MEGEKNDYYVYFHLDGEEIVYIGYGRGSRCCSSVGRKGGHAPFMDSKISAGDFSFIAIIENSLCKEDAVKLEERLIKETQPAFNKFFTESWKNTNRDRGLKGAEVSKKRCRTPLGIFPSISEAAKAHGYKSVSSITQFIKAGKEGYSYED